MTGRDTQRGRLLGGGRALDAGRDPHDQRQGDGDGRRHHPEDEDPPASRWEEPPAEIGPDDEVDEQRVDAEPHQGGTVTGDEGGQQLAGVQLPLGDGGVGEELAGSPFPLADDGVRANRGGDGERHDHRDRCQQVDGDGKRGPDFGGIALDALLNGERQRVEHGPDLRDHLAVLGTRHDVERNDRDDDEEQRGQQTHG